MKEATETLEHLENENNQLTNDKERLEDALQSSKDTVDHLV